MVKITVREKLLSHHSPEQSNPQRQMQINGRSGGRQRGEMKKDTGIHFEHSDA